MAGPGVTAANAAGLWAVDSAGLLRQLLRTGPSSIATPSGLVTQNILSLTTLGADAGAFGVGRSYNATGSIAVKVVLKD